MIHQIEALQKGFQTLSKTSTLKDLTAQFAATVGEMFPGTNLDLLHKAGTAEHWDPLVNGADAGVEMLLPLPQGQSGSAISVSENPAKVCVVQRLSDASHIGIILRWPDGTGPRVDGDEALVRLSVRLFELAYREMQSRRKEKALGFSLNQRVLQLNSLIDTGIEVSKLDRDAFPHQLALQRAASLTNASKGVVRIRIGDRLMEEITFPVGVHLEGAGDESHRIRTNFSFGKDTYSFELFDKESRSGVEPFDETDQLLLDALAKQVQASLENRFLHKQSLEKQRIEQDIAVAASIQQKILPTSLPILEGFDIAGINIPSITVGGDYYDCIPLPDGRYALIIADVAGKGVPAALLVSTLHAYVQAYLETTISIMHLAHRLNRVISSASTDEKFITAIIALLSPDTGEVESINAGHNPAYWRKKDGSVEELGVGGLAFGMLDINFPYTVEHVTLGPGERLLLYTDGITEARNHKDRLYDTDHPLKDFVGAHTPDRAEEFISNLVKDIKAFTGDAPQSDDITALYLVRH